MPVQLTIDLQGAASRWRQGGANAAAALFDDFNDLVLDTVAGMDVGAQIRGDLEGDWCSLVCPSIESTLSLARRIFRRAWLEARTTDDLRLWLRAVVTATEDEAVRHTAPDEELPNIRRTTAAPGLLRALTALRSGFRGMRILVEEELLSDPLRGMFRVPLGRLGFIPFRRMNFTPYPPTTAKNLQDFLWMAETPGDWSTYLLRMKQRTMWSAQESHEAEDASATQIVFCEVDAILQSVLRKNQSRGTDHRPGGGAPRNREHTAPPTEREATE